MDEARHSAVSAACTTEGVREYWECSGCGIIFDDGNGTTELNEIPVIAALGHSWNNGEITTPATETTEGVKTYTCTACGETKTESIPNYKDTAEEPVVPPKNDVSETVLIPAQKDNNTQQQTALPNTGDTAPIAVVFILMLMSAFLTVISVKLIKKNK